MENNRGLCLPLEARFSLVSVPTSKVALREFGDRCGVDKGASAHWL